MNTVHTPTEKPDRARIRNPGKGILLVLAGAACISFSAVFVKLAHVGPTSAVFYRLLFGTLCLNAWALYRGESVIIRALGPAFRVYGFLLLCSLVLFLDLDFWHRSIHEVGPGLATILANFQVFFIAFFGVLFLGERLNLRFVIAVIAALFGLYLIVGPDASPTHGNPGLGLVFGFAAAFFYAAYILMLRKSRMLKRPVTEGAGGADNSVPIKPYLSDAANMAVITAVTCVIVGGVHAAGGGDFSIPDTQSLIALIAYGAGPQAAGWILLSMGLPRVQASVAGLAILIQPALAFIWDILFFARPTGFFGILGAAIAIGAVWLGILSRAAKK